MNPHRIALIWFFFHVGFSLFVFLLLLLRAQFSVFRPLRRFSRVLLPFTLLLDGYGCREREKEREKSGISEFRGLEGEREGLSGMYVVLG